MDARQNIRAEEVALMSAPLFSYPPREEDAAARAAHVSEVERHSSEGRKIIFVCCERCREYLTGAIDAGTSATELDALADFFKGHTNTDFGAPRHKGRLDIPAIVSDVLALADALPEELRAYFLEAVFADVQERNRAPHRAAYLLKFNAEFTRRRYNDGRGKAAQAKQATAPADFPPEMVDTLRQALRSVGLLSEAGQYLRQYRGKLIPIRAAYWVFVRKGWFAPGYQTQKAFVTWLAQNFGITTDPDGRSLRNDTTDTDEHRGFEAAFSEIIQVKQ